MTKQPAMVMSLKEGGPSLATYVMPNVNEFRPLRSSLAVRFDRMCDINESIGENAFWLVEVPGDFVKSASERNETGLAIGSMLTAESATLLYQASPDELIADYILHTEPGVPRRAAHGTTAALRWCDQAWLAAFVSHIVSIASVLKHLPSYIEVHPGMSQGHSNTIQTLASGIAFVSDALAAEWGLCPQLLLENRTGQIVQRGNQARALWEELLKYSPGIAHRFGLTVDFQQLFTANGKDNSRLLEDLDTIPTEAVRGCHVHRKHSTPHGDDGLEWYGVQGFCSRVRKDVLVLPEVHYLKDVSGTYAFCRNPLHLIP